MYKRKIPKHGSGSILGLEIQVLKCLDITKFAGVNGVNGRNVCIAQRDIYLHVLLLTY